jgi:hypothetical protein
MLLIAPLDTAQQAQVFSPFSEALQRLKGSQIHCFAQSQPQALHLQVTSMGLDKTLKALTLLTLGGVLLRHRR